MATEPRQRIHPASSAAAGPSDLPLDASLRHAGRFVAGETCSKLARPGLGTGAPQRQSVNALVGYLCGSGGGQLVKRIRWNEH
jgi:hypothetical protein